MARSSYPAGTGMLDSANAMITKRTKSLYIKIGIRCDDCQVSDYF